MDAKSVRGEVERLYKLAKEAARIAKLRSEDLRKKADHAKEIADKAVVKANNKKAIKDTKTEESNAAKKAANHAIGEFKVALAHQVDNLSSHRYL